ncbi:MAG: hypothetical protein IPJ48_16665 [Propionivibrio sp.]|uniref:Uncharacterized protein n=1 Tax=Candidatus Propionivibrio dominans TaxID=2954373 RepID=A0A9D7I9W6_9RHOO|nr:hypothetical protein [Candidatus Propionivibrio dominans]
MISSSGGAQRFSPRILGLRPVDAAAAVMVSDMFDNYLKGRIDRLTSRGL